MSLTLHILLPVHNRCDVTRRFIMSLKRQTFQNFHLLLIDDGSTDGTEQMVRDEISCVTVLKGKGDWWWGGALHQGYTWLLTNAVSSSDVALIINDDTEFGPTFLEQGMALVTSSNGSLLLAQSYSKQTDTLVDAGVHVDWKRLSFVPASTEEEINCLSTRGLFLKVGDFLKVGGFYPRLLPHYASDYEFTMRAASKGLKLTTSALLKLWVDEETTGCHDLNDASFFVALKQLFSKKTALNPIFWTTFILISCPWRWKITNCIRVWKNTTALVVRSALARRCAPKSLTS